MTAVTTFVGNKDLARYGALGKIEGKINKICGNINFRKTPQSSRKITELINWAFWLSSRTGVFYSLFTMMTAPTARQYKIEEFDAKVAIGTSLLLLGAMITRPKRLGIKEVQVKEIYDLWAKFICAYSKKDSKKMRQSLQGLEYKAKNFPKDFRSIVDTQDFLSKVKLIKAVSYLYEVNHKAFEKEEPTSTSLLSWSKSSPVNKKDKKPRIEKCFEKAKKYLADEIIDKNDYKNFYRPIKEIINPSSSHSSSGKASSSAPGESKSKDD